MYIRVGKKYAIALLIQLMALIYTCFYLFVFDNTKTFVDYSRYGTFIIVVFMFCFLKAQGRIFTVQTLFLVLFILFQFGLPVVYAFEPYHYNFYLTLFDNNILINGIKYTILAILVYVLTATIMSACKPLQNSEVKIGKWENTIINNQKTVAIAALLLFLVTAAVAVPVNLWSAMKALMAGGNIGNAYRGIMTERGITRFLQEYYFSSALLFLCFSKNKNVKLMVSSLYIIVAFSLVVVADRSGGITALVVYALYQFYSQGERKRKKNSVILIIVGVLLAGISSAVANIRLGTTDTGIMSLLFGAIEEMGFNFTSLCFVMDYIPSTSDFRLGLSYLVAIVLLIPKTFGLSAIYPKLQSYLGETWLWNSNNLYGREFLSFGVGFSVIAESYYNFAWAGILVMIPLALIITHFLRERNVDSPWSLYVRLALMLSFFTVPRRQFQSVVKGLEYSIFFMAIYLIAFILIKKNVKGIKE